MKVDELLISAKRTSWRKPISLADYGSMRDSAISRKSRNALDGITGS
jgi:hypothetical protein